MSASVPLSRVFTVGDLLSQPPFADAEVIAARDAVGTRPTEWISVLEWPIEDFVAPGETILTTGVGCGARRLTRLLREIIEAGAACICIAFQPSGDVRAVPQAIIDLAEQEGVPIVVLPWEVRFADCVRAFVDGMLSQRYGSPPGGIAGAFTGALLGESGVEAVASELERMIVRPVLVLDAQLDVKAEGTRLRRTLGQEGLERLRRLASELEAGARARFREQVDGLDPVAVQGFEPLALGSAIAIAARARHRTLGYLVALESDSAASGLPSLDRGALADAATAVAIEMLRSEAVQRAEERVSGEALWRLASGHFGGSEDVASVAARLGLTTSRQFEVAVGEVGGDDELAELSVKTVALAEDLRRRNPSATVGSHARELLVLVAAGPQGRARLRALIGGAAGEADVSWGLADGPVSLELLPRARKTAERALAVGRSLHGSGQVGDARELGPFLLLHGLADDDDALEMARDVLGPLVQYDDKTARDYLNTLEVFLAEHGNATAAARRLYLNRHSLGYRLRKIEALTGRSLSNHDDRFLLELSLRMLKL